MLRDVALPAALGRYGGCLEAYAEAGAPAPDRAHPPRSWSSGWAASGCMERMRTDRSVAERYPASAARLAGPGRRRARRPSLAESIDLLLSRVALSRSDGSRTDDRRVSLLTLHATKGLEFSRVYIVGRGGQPDPRRGRPGATRNGRRSRRRADCSTWA